jgi:hypothetical protein
MVAYRTEIPLDPGEHTLAVTAVDEVAAAVASHSGRILVDGSGEISLSD